MSQEWSSPGFTADSLPEPGREAQPPAAGRTIGVEVTAGCPKQGPGLDPNPDFLRLIDRLELSRQVVEKLQARGEFQLERLLVQTLDHFVAAGQFDGMIIASAEGLVIAQSTTADRAEILAAVGSLFEHTVRRAQSEGLITSAGEMTLRGFAGEWIAVRYFPEPEDRFFLIAYSTQPRPHRRVTTRALRVCGDLLLHSRRPKPALPGSRPKMTAISASEPTGIDPAALPNGSDPAGVSPVPVYALPGSRAASSLP